MSPPLHQPTDHLAVSDRRSPDLRRQHSVAESTSTMLTQLTGQTVASGYLSSRLSSFPAPPPSPGNPSFQAAQVAVPHRGERAQPTMSSAPLDHNRARCLAPRHSISSTLASGLTGVSVNPSEEILLTTEFITDMLTRIPESPTTPSSSRFQTMVNTPVEQAFGRDTLAGQPRSSHELQQVESTGKGKHRESFSTHSFSAPTVAPSHVHNVATVRHSSMQSADSVTLYSATDDVLRSSGVSPWKEDFLTEEGEIPIFSPDHEKEKPTYGWITDGPDVPEDIIDDGRGGVRTPSLFPTRRRRKSVSALSAISSVVSRVSHSTSQSVRDTFKNGFAWKGRNLPPLPSSPPLPDPDHGFRSNNTDFALSTAHVPRHGQHSISLSHPQEKLSVDPHRPAGGPTRGMFGVFDNDSVLLARNRRVVQPNADAYPVLSPALPDETSFLQQQQQQQQQRRTYYEYGLNLGQPSPRQPSPFYKQKKFLFVILVLGFLVIAAVLIGVLVSRRKHDSPSCVGNMTGFKCTIDATCTCISGNQGSCVLVAQSLLDLAQPTSQLFSVNITEQSLALATWDAVGKPINGVCTEQAQLIDVSQSLDASHSPVRFRWAQAALVYTLYQSGNKSETESFREWIAGTNFFPLSAPDGPTLDTDGKFAHGSLGYLYDLANLTVTPPNLTYPSMSSGGTAQVPSSALVAPMNKLYSYAVASSTQRESALNQYWTGTLNLASDKLISFKQAVASSPVLLPFDGTLQALASLANDTQTPSFPPPIACHPSLTNSQVQAINALETQVFGLGNVTAPSRFDPACFASHPIYGVLDVLRLRLAFLNVSSGTPQQAAAVSSPAMVLYSGERLSRLPGIPNENLSGAVDPRNFGVINQFNHVLLNWLQSMPASLATQAALWISQNSTVPPNNDSSIWSQLDEIPVLEVAVFSPIQRADVQFAVTPISSPTGGLFFGTNQGEALRSWALSSPNSQIVWTADSLSPEVVRELPSDPGVDAVWKPASQLAARGSTGAAEVAQVVKSFQDIQRFGP